MTVAYTKHAQTRAQQRGFRAEDVDVLLAYADEVDDGLYLSRQAAHRAIQALKSEIKRLERLKNTRAVILEGRVVTLYKRDSGVS